MPKPVMRSKLHMTKSLWQVRESTAAASTAA